MATFTATALSDQKGYKAISIQKPDGTNVDIFPMLKDMGLVPYYASNQLDPSLAYNTRVGNVVGNKVAKLSFDVKLFEDKKAEDIASLKVAGFNEQELKHYEDFIFAQAFRKTTFKYSKEDLVDGQKVFGKQIPSVAWTRLLNQRRRDKEVATFNKLLEAFYHFQDIGIDVWDIEKNSTTGLGTIKKTSGKWTVKKVNGTTKSLVNAYGDTVPMLKRLQQWKTGADAFAKNMQLLGDLNVDISKQGHITSALYGHMHLEGVNIDDIITAMPENAIIELSTYGGRMPSAMAQKDMQTGEILQGTIFGANYLIANNLPTVNTVKSSGVWGTPKPIKAIKFPRGVFAPIVWISNTGLDAVMDYPNYKDEAATTHRVLEMTNEWDLAFIKQYTNLIYIVYGDTDYNSATTV